MSQLESDSYSTELKVTIKTLNGTLYSGKIILKHEYSSDWYSHRYSGDKDKLFVPPADIR